MIQQLSYWEKDTFFKTYDAAIIGGGIVGLLSAVKIKEQNPSWSVVILERATIPYGATTRNAGFACFGSLSELLSDEQKMGQAAMLQLVDKRIEGLEILMATAGKENIDFQPIGGYELFTPAQESLYQNCCLETERMNVLLQSITKNSTTFANVNEQIAPFKFKNLLGMIYNPMEGGVHSGKLAKTLIEKANKLGINIFNGCEVLGLEEKQDLQIIKSKYFDVKAYKVVIATNAFTQDILPVEDLEPGRGQVLITKPISNLPFEGTFHLEEGYFYFRTIANRVLFGGGRHLDFEKENTTDFELNSFIQNHLELLLQTVILPTTPFEIDYRWTGIMAFGSSKLPIIKTTSQNTILAIRCNGMGIALAGSIAKEVAKLIA